MIGGQLREGMLVNLAALWLLAGCSPGHTRDPATLQAIRAEAQALMANPQVDASSRVPESRWPPAIAALRPEWVRIDEDGVEIPVRIYFDDSWGYFIPRDPRKPLKPRSGYSALGEGIYWYHFS
ncbi:hypothetical protein HZY97_11005 [Sphingomonas sp. R-74633]|nr:hypothetical protein [Sphingomonas sp. R-74633]